MTATHDELLLLIKARPLAEVVLQTAAPRKSDITRRIKKQAAIDRYIAENQDALAKWERRQAFLDSLPGVPLMTANALMYGGYWTHEAIAAATDTQLLRCRQLGKRGLRYIRAVVPYSGGDV